MTGKTDIATEGQTKPMQAPNQEKVSLESLSSLTGFPIEFIKKELLVEGEELSMKELRDSMVRYLESHNQEFNKQ